MLSTKNIVFKERPVKKLMERYVGLYMVEEVVLKNVVKLKLLASMRIHSVVNISRIVKYRESVKRQRIEKLKPVEVNEVEEWKIEKILNKRKVRGVIKYLVHWKRFTVENDTQEKEKELKIQKNQQTSLKKGQKQRLDDKRS